MSCCTTSKVINGAMSEQRRNTQISQQLHAFSALLLVLHTQTCHAPGSSSRLINRAIEQEVACKQRLLNQCVTWIRLLSCGERSVFCQWATHWSHWNWLGFRCNGSFHRRGGGQGAWEVCVCVCQRGRMERWYKWDSVFTTQRGCEKKNWLSTWLWFHFGDIESLDPTSEATKEQFSVPITAHSSWCDCCVAVISLVGGRRSAAGSLHKNSLPVAQAWRLVLPLLVLMDALVQHVFTSRLHSSFITAHVAVTLQLQFHKRL